MHRRPALLIFSPKIDASFRNDITPYKVPNEKTAKSRRHNKTCPVQRLRAKLS